MSEPSKEALERARAIVGSSMRGRDFTQALATSLQELVSDRDLWKTRAEKAKANWDAAEEKAADFAIDNVDLAKRAEKVEALAELRLKTIGEYAEASAMNAIKLDLTNMKLAKLLQKVREWCDDPLRTGQTHQFLELSDILAKFEVKP